MAALEVLWLVLGVGGLGLGASIWAGVFYAVVVLGLAALMIWAWLTPRGYPVRAVRAYEGGVVVASRPGGDFSYTWNEVDGFRDTGGVRPWAPRYRNGAVVASLALVLRDREVGLGGCPREQRERLVQVVEQHLAGQQMTRREGA